LEDPNDDNNQARHLIGEKALLTLRFLARRNEFVRWKGCLHIPMQSGH
jgi:hypothetical protein